MERLTIKDKFGQCGCLANKHADAMNKLGEYEDAEEAGTLLRLPCKIGTTIYYVQKCLFPGACAACKGFVLVPNCYTNYKGRIFEKKFEYRHLSEFGKTVFLTREEAEAALQKLKEGE